MKNIIITLCSCLILGFQLNAQVNPVDSATVWDMWMVWNPVHFQSLYPQMPFVQNGTSAIDVAWNNGRVTMMGAQQNDILQGTLPSTIQNLTELTLIDIRQNPNLTGSIPPELGSLTHLKKILISQCGFTGTIPSEIGNLSNLETLNIGNLGITGEIPTSFQNLHKLIGFYFGNSNVNGNLPGYFGLLDTLEILWCMKNPSFGGILSDSLCLSQSLQELRINKNAFYGTLPSCIGNIPSLLALDISHNNFTGAIPQSLFPPASNYIELTADSNHLTSLPFIPHEQSPLPPYSYLYYMRVYDIRWNKLQFGDFENTYLNGCSYCIQGPIAPQDSVWSLLDTTVLVNTTVTLNSTVTGQHNTYYWYKNGVLIDSTINGLLAIPNIQHSDSGVYTCNVTNLYISNWSGYPGNQLILNRSPITLHVVNSLNSIEISNTNLMPGVYPNPFDQALTVQLRAQINGPTSLSLINVSGKTVMQAKTQANEYIFNTEKLPAGLYLLKAETGRSVATVRVRKE
ncbi:MAG: T9SS type A sorting domain-containing protein [Bacteroidia bacterium]|nr:T9SS type A sorting domain-containing protein [Bacteroidia bacterium]